VMRYWGAPSPACPQGCSPWSENPGMAPAHPAVTRTSNSPAHHGAEPAGAGAGACPRPNRS
jgi:hypothetical protein